MAEDMVLPLLAGMWLPNIIFAIMTGIIFWRVEQERPIFSERLTLWLESVIDALFLAPLKRLAKLFRQLLSKRHGDGARSKKKKKSCRVGQECLFMQTQKRVFHLPDCEQYHCKSCTLEFNSTFVAYEAGFAPVRTARHRSKNIIVNI